MKTNPVVKFFDEHDAETLIDRKADHVSIGNYRTTDEWPQWISWAKQGLSPHDIAGRRRGTSDVVQSVLFALDMYAFDRWNTDRSRETAYDIIVTYYTTPEITSAEIAEAYDESESEVSRIVSAVHRRQWLVNHGINPDSVKVYSIPPKANYSPNKDMSDDAINERVRKRARKKARKKYKGRNVTVRVKK